MRICLDYRPALRDGTGVGTYVRDLLRALAEGYPSDDYTAFSASWRDRLNSLDTPNVAVSDWRIPVRALDRAWHRWEWPPVERLVGRQDIAHSPSPMLLPSRTARKLITVHDCYFLREPQEVFGPVRRDYVPLAERAAAHADAILVPSVVTAGDVVELLGAPAERVHVTPYGVDPFFSETRDPAENTALLSGFELGDRYILTVGRREPRKDLGNLLAATAELADSGIEFRLAIVGPEAPGWTRTWEEAPAAARRLCRLLPYQPRKVLAQLYANTAALVIPSRWEGFGLTGLEAMSAGGPVIATRVGSLPEVLGDAALWVEPGDSAALAEACRRMLEDEELAERHRRRGHEQAMGYRWEHTAELTHAVYSQVIG